MKLIDLINQTSPPQPWSEGEKIPWDEPGFSRRMLNEHLSQEHDAASRRFSLVDRHVAWIHQHILDCKPSSILDLGCGPGLYASRLTRLGHTCLGIDFSPASIAYARQQAEAEGLTCSYRQQDIRRAGYGEGFDLVMFIFGELNAFRPSDARLILQKAWAALAPEGRLLLEVSTFESLHDLGQQPPDWNTHSYGLFSDGPHLVLSGSFWDSSEQALTERYYVMQENKNEIECIAATRQAYTHQQYHELLAECGFSDVVMYPSLMGEPDPDQSDFITLLCK